MEILYMLICFVIGVAFGIGLVALLGANKDSDEDREIDDNYVFDDDLK